ncbi:PcfJ domain-containing protein [Cereibacter sphaeroides]|uniref:PcfJ domain-containing protein n=1 Tax=Cereibacter sphaeroides TaxID=1063 RepID=UPI001F2EE0D3|nr:PcfJ domain-containing protein [Cereibacter sphaeroides]MCE6959676.1 PcfJ domain-containing protein [Cereibacter sphaeroides]MCE6974463.1 PcfJ domain-containing protein [Cereibacter sphaeroides]
MFDIIHRIQDHLRQGLADLLPSAGSPGGQELDPVADMEIEERDLPGESAHGPDGTRDAAGDPERFTFLRTVLAANGYTDTQIRDVQHRYDFAVRHGRTWLSKPGEVEGWRRVATIGVGRGRHRVIGVTEAGFFVMAEVSFPAAPVLREEPRVSGSGTARRMRNPGASGYGDPLWIDLDAFVGPLPGQIAEFKRLDLPPGEMVRRLLDFDDTGIRIRAVDPSCWTFNTHARAFRKFCDEMAEFKKAPFKELPDPSGKTDAARKSARRAKGKLCGMVHHETTRRMKRILFALWDELDPDMRRLMRSTLAMTGEDAQWFSGVARHRRGMDPRQTTRYGIVAALSGDPDMALARQQAVRAFPVLLTKIKAEGIEQVIDARQPLIPALSSATALPPAMIQAMRGLTWQRAATKPGKPDLVGWSEVEPQYLPRTRKGFRAFAELGTFATKASIPSELLRKRARGRYEEVLHQLNRVGPEGLTDHLRDVFRRLVVPIALDRHPEWKPEIFQSGWRGAAHLSPACGAAQARFIRACLTTIPIKDIVEGSIGWHRNLGNIDRDLGVDAMGQEWQPLAGTRTTPDGLVLREILSLPDLRRQGKRERHCVGTYGDKVTRWQGKPDTVTIIVSIERGDLILSTAELGIRTGHMRDSEREIIERLEVEGVRVVQNRARGNEAPVPEAVSAAAHLARDLSKLPEGALEAYAEGLAAWRRLPRNGALSPEAELLNADLEAPDYLARAWKALSPLLPRGVRKAGPDRLLDAPLLADSLSEFRPLVIEDQHRKVPDLEVDPW